MKMIYHQRDNYRRRNRLYTIGFSVLALVIFLLLANKYFPKFFTPAVQIVEIPVSGTQTIASQTSSGVFGLVYSKYALVMENRALRERMVAYEALQVDRDRLLKENEQLQDLFAKGSTTKKHVIAKLISKPGFSPYDTVVINKGELDGLALGDIALVGGIEIVGEISNLSSHTATITLFSSSERKTNVLIGPRAIEAVAVGKGGGNFELKLPRNTNVDEGDTVVLAQYPDKTFGVIETIHTDDSDSFENILFRNPVDVSSVKFVSIEHK